MSLRTCYFCTVYMKSRPFQILPSLRVLYTFFLFGFGSICLLNAQVPTTVTQSVGARQNERNIHVEWSVQDEARWHEDNDGRLDIMSLKTDIGIEQFQPDPKGNNVFQLKFDHPCMIECMVQVNASDPAEAIYLYNKTTGDWITDLKPIGKSSFLTPSFDPETTEIIWKSADGGSHRSD